MIYRYQQAEGIMTQKVYPKPSVFTINEHKAIARWMLRMGAADVPVFVNHEDYADKGPNTVEVIEVDRPRHARQMAVDGPLGLLPICGPDQRDIALCILKRGRGFVIEGYYREERLGFRTLAKALDHAAKLMGVDLSKIPDPDSDPFSDLPEWLQ